METLSKQVARAEEELGFWTGIYSQEIPMTAGTALQQVERLESNLENYREKYRAELERDLGQDFSINPLVTSDYLWHIYLRNYFFPLEYQKCFSGIILPFMKEKKVMFNPRLKDNKHATEVFHNKDYRIENMVCGMNITEASSLVIRDEENLRLVLAHEDLI